MTRGLICVIIYSIDGQAGSLDSLEAAEISYTVWRLKVPVYDYQCKICSDKKTIRRSFKDKGDIECCGVPMVRNFRSAPSTAIKPQHQAVGSTFKHHGIKDPITGE